MFGVCSSLAEVVNKMSEKIGDKTAIPYFDSFTTTNYKLSFMKTPTGLFFIFITKPDSYNYSKVLKTIYSRIYVKYVALNPLAEPKSLISSPKFNKAISDYIKDIYAQVSNK